MWLSAWRALRMGVDGAACKWLYASGCMRAACKLHGVAWLPLRPGRRRPAPPLNPSQGIVDSHTHFIPGGLSLSGVDLRRAASKEEFVAAVEAAAGKLGPDEWVLGGFWDGESRARD